MQLREIERRKAGTKVVQQTIQEAEVAPVGEYCVVCNAPIKGTGRMLGGRAYCEAHYRRMIQGRSGTWRATLGLIAGLLVFVGLTSLVAQNIGPLAQGFALLIAGLLLALVPAVIWLIVFYLQDRLEPEPKRYVLGVFALGAVLSGAIGQPLIASFFRVNEWAGYSVWSRVAADVLIVGVVQSFLIYAAVRYTVFRSDEFDEPVDGIIYGAAAGLGYASMMSISYVVSHGGVDLGVGAIRVAVTALAYASFGGVLGYFLGQAKFEDHSPLWLPFGVILTAVLNGIVTSALEIVSRSGLQSTPFRGLLLSSLIAAAVFLALFAFMRRSNSLVMAGRAQ
jgi:RsiW-degrading membrane proteinase PrsW (M82 family)